MARILVVDDEEDILKALSALLKTHGHEPVTVSESDKAQAIILNEDFDLMIFDIRMSPINGIELLRIAQEKGATTPVIMLTAYGQVDTAIEALQLGAFDYVKKPFRTTDLLALVTKALESRALMESSE